MANVSQSSKLIDIYLPRQAIGY